MRTAPISLQESGGGEKEVTRQTKSPHWAMKSVHLTAILALGERGFRDRLVNFYLKRFQSLNWIEG